MFPMLAQVESNPRGVRRNSPIAGDSTDSTHGTPACGSRRRPDPGESAEGQAGRGKISLLYALKRFEMRWDSIFVNDAKTEKIKI